MFKPPDGYQVAEINVRYVREGGSTIPVDPPPSRPVDPPTPVEPPSEGGVWVLPVPIGTLSSVRGERDLTESLTNLKEGDTIVYEMDPGRHVAGWFEIRPSKPAHIVIKGNGCEIDVSGGRFFDDGSPAAYPTGTEGQGVIVPTPNCLSLTLSDMTIRSWDYRGSRCLRLRGQEFVHVDNVVFDAMHQGIQGACKELIVRNSKFLDTARNDSSGMSHAVYAVCDRVTLEDNEVQTANGHAFKVGGADVQLRRNKVMEGTGNTGGCFDWLNGSGVAILDSNKFVQNPSTGNRAMISLHGNVDTWIGGGELRMRDNKLHDLDPRGAMASVFKYREPRITVTDVGGNKYNGSPLVI